MKKLLKKMMATLLAAYMMLSTSVTVFAENNVTMIAGYECYERDGEYYTMIDGTEYHIVMFEETEIVTDPVLLEQLNSLFDENSNARNGYPSSWPNARTLDISDGSTYTARANLNYADYYSPGLIVDISADGNGSAGTIRVDYVTSPGTTTYYIDVTFHFYSVGEWKSTTKKIGFNSEIKNHILFMGTTATTIDKVCFKLAKNGAGNGAFDFSYTQP